MQNSKKNSAGFQARFPGQVYLLAGRGVIVDSAHHGQCRGLSSLMDACIPLIVGFSLSRDKDYDDHTTLDTVVRDKESLCRDYGVPFRPSDWVETDFPLVIVGDYWMEIAPYFGIEVQAHLPYRGVNGLWLERALRDFSKALARTTSENANQTLIKEVIRWNQRVLNDSWIVPGLPAGESPQSAAALWTYVKNNIAGKGRSHLSSI